MEMAPSVLVVEDSSDTLEIICEFLASYGFKILTAMNGKEAIDKYNESNPDILLVDVLLPKINGFKVCETIKKAAKGPSTPVIMMSALYKSYGMQQEAKEKYGADEYLLKPIDLMKLVNTICRLLNINKDELAQKAKADAESKKLGPPKPYTTPSLQGDIDKHLPLDVLSWMRDGKITGIYEQTRQNAKRTVYVLEGDPIYVTSNLLSESLGKILVQDGVINEEELKKAHAESKRTGGSMSKTLMGLGLLNQASMTKALLNETYTRFTNIMSWFSGIYTITEDDSWKSKIKRPKVPFEQLVYQAIKKHYTDDMISKQLHPGMPFKVDKLPENLDRVGQIEWEVEELETFALINGERSFTEIQEMSNQPVETNRRIIFTLFKLGIITFV